MMDTDTDDNREDKSTLSGLYSKPHLDPTAVLALSTSVPNCSRMTPHLPKDERTLAPSRSSAAAAAVHHRPTADCTTSNPASSYLSFLVSDAYSVSESASYFSSIQSRRGRGEAHWRERAGGGGHGDHLPGDPNRNGGGGGSGGESSAQREVRARGSRADNAELT